MARALALVVALVLATLGVHAEEFVVNKTEDDNGACTTDDCALREAILAANSQPGMDTVRIPAGVYQLSLPENLDLGGDVDIVDDVEILGIPDATVVVGNGLPDDESRVFDIKDEPISARIVGLTLQGGQADLGGGIRVSNNSVVEMIDCEIRENFASFDGGAISQTVAELTLTRTTIANNVAGRSGGAISRAGVAGSGFDTTLVIRNSTISGNTAGLDGGAIESFGGSGEILIENSTIVDNHADSFGDLIFQELSVAPQFSNSVLEGDCFFVSSQFPISLGGNVGKATDFCFLDEPSDQAPVGDLGLLPLGDYGGPTPTHALDPASPAIDSALLDSCPTRDQRGLSRPEDGDLDGVAECDAGAFEARSGPLATIPTVGELGLVVLALLLATVAALRLPR